MVDNTRMRELFEAIKANGQNVVDADERIRRVEDDLGKIHQRLELLANGLEQVISKVDDRSMEVNSRSIDCASLESFDLDGFRMSSHMDLDARHMFDKTPNSQTGTIFSTSLSPVPCEFHGINPQEWLYQANLYFKNSVEEWNTFEKVKYAYYFMFGLAETWFVETFTIEPKENWECFCEKMVNRFAYPFEKKKEVVTFADAFEIFGVNLDDYSKERVDVQNGKDSLDICRVVNGTGQTSGGRGRFERDKVVDARIQYADAGLNTFDSADIYGPAEDLYGILTKGVHRGRPPEYPENLRFLNILKSGIPVVGNQKYKSMVDAWGGWSLFQGLLRTMKNVTSKHGVSIPTVAVRLILDQQAVAEIKEYVYRLAKDQCGCLFLQRRFEEGTFRDVQIQTEHDVHDVHVLCDEANGFTTKMLLKLEAIEALQKLSTENERLKKKCLDECSEKKKLYNEVIELKGNIRMFCRCRPMKHDEVTNGSTPILEFDSSQVNELHIVSTNFSRNHFRFDYVFRPGDDQETVFVQTQPIVAYVLDCSDMGQWVLKIQPYKAAKVNKTSNITTTVVVSYNRIYIGNLSWYLTEEDLKKLFSDCTIVAIRFGVDMETCELKESAEEIKVLVDERFSELQYAKVENQNLSKQLQELQNEFKESKPMHTSSPFSSLNEQVKQWNTEAERYRTLAGELQNMTRSKGTLLQKHDKQELYEEKRSRTLLLSNRIWDPGGNFFMVC